MNSNLLIPELQELLAKNEVAALKEFCETEHPAIIAEFLGGLDPESIWRVLTPVDHITRADIFSHLESERQVEVAEGLSRKDLADLITEMPPDDRVDLVKRFPETRRNSVLSALAQAEREDIRRLSVYAEGTAGSIMTSEYVTLPARTTAARAIATIRREAPNKETIYYAYILDRERRLIGFTSLKDLILADPKVKVMDIMHEEVIAVHASDDQEYAARILQKYDLLALPVLDEKDALVGIITHDDALDVITQEQTEDLEKLMAIGGSHEAVDYMKTSAWEHFRRRVGWIVGLAVLGLFSGMVIHSFEALLSSMIILALYMPMLADTGGNTGSQAATLVIRALALREISPRDFFRVIGKEFAVALMLSLVLGIVTWVRVMFLSRAAEIPHGFSLPLVGLAIAMALGVQVISATLIGAVLPLAASKLKLDPAVVASPALTTVVDITGLLIYFSTVRIVLGI